MKGYIYKKYELLSEMWLRSFIMKLYVIIFHILKH